MRDLGHLPQRLRKDTRWVLILHGTSDVLVDFYGRTTNHSVAFNGAHGQAADAKFTFLA